MGFRHAFHSRVSRSGRTSKETQSAKRGCGGRGRARQPSGWARTGARWGCQSSRKHEQNCEGAAAGCSRRPAGAQAHKKWCLSAEGCRLQPQGGVQKKGCCAAEKKGDRGAHVESAGSAATVTGGDTRQGVYAVRRGRQLGARVRLLCCGRTLMGAEKG